MTADIVMHDRKSLRAIALNNGYSLPIGQVHKEPLRGHGQKKKLSGAHQKLPRGDFQVDSGDGDVWFKAPWI